MSLPQGHRCCIPWCVNEGWEAPRAGYKVIGVPKVCIISQLMEQALMLWTLLGHFLLRLALPCHALPCCSAVPLLCLVLVFIPPGQGSSFPVEGTYPICSY